MIESNMFNGELHWNFMFGKFLRFVGWVGGGESGKGSLEILEEILTLKEDQQLFEARVTTRRNQTMGRLNMMMHLMMILMINFLKQMSPLVKTRQWAC